MAVHGLEIVVSSSPTVSVVIPLHNKARYILETLQSLIAQTFSNWEAIVIENGSSDESVNNVLEVKDPRTRLVMAPDNVRGPGAARNLGVDLARAPWILFLDADDLLEPTHLESLLNVAEIVPLASVIAGGWKEFIEGNNSAIEFRSSPGVKETASDVLDRSMAAAPWAVHAAIVRRSWLTNKRIWPVELDHLPSEDSAFWFRVLIGATLSTVSGPPTAIYRKETPGSRDTHRDLSTWTEAVLGVIRFNENTLNQLGMQPTRLQAANLVRTLESLYFRCRKNADEQYAKQVLREAEKWLRQTSKISFSMAARKLLGIPRFQRLRNLKTMLSIANDGSS